MTRTGSGSGAVGGGAGAGRRRRARPGSAIEPGDVLRPGRADATTVLTLWLVRRAFAPLFLLGMVGGALAAAPGEEETTELDSAGEVVAGIVSPFAGVILALVSWVGASVAAYLVAYPLAHAAPLAVGAHPSGPRGALGRAVDRFHLTRAIRDLRATRAVHDEARRRLGARGDRMATVARALSWSTVPLLVLLPVAAAVG